MLKVLLMALSTTAALAELVPDPKVPGRLLLSEDVSSGVVSLKTPAPHITEAYFANDEERTSLTGIALKT